MNRRPKRSSLWNFFAFIDDVMAQCDICGHRLSYRSTTSNLKKHLERKHSINADAIKRRGEVTYLLTEPLDEIMNGVQEVSEGYEEIVDAEPTEPDSAVESKLKGQSRVIQAYDQADVYETNELPESDQNTDFYEEESDSIERLHISASEAFNRFKGKTLSASNVDFSDQLNKKWRTGYDARSGAWELVGVGEKETPLQKYQRLQCEMKELADEVAELKESAKESSAQEQSVCTLLATQVEQAQQQLAKMRLEETLGTELITDFTDAQGAQFMKMLAELDSLKQGVDKPSRKPLSGGDSEPYPGTITYQLKYQPERTALARSARIADLEQRLHKLETAVGATPQKMATLCVDPKDKGRPCSLLQAAQLLNAKVSLLDTGHLDQVEGRLVALAEKMDTAAEKGSSKAQDAERDRKIAELYELVKSSSEDLSAILPTTLDRLLALESLHQQALDFSRSLSQLETLQEQITSNLQDNEVYMKSVQQSFSQNVESIKKNIETLETRINAIKKK